MGGGLTQSFHLNKEGRLRVHLTKQWRGFHFPGCQVYKCGAIGRDMDFLLANTTIYFTEKMGHLEVARKFKGDVRIFASSAIILI